jgi:hypothetical protein
VLSALLVTLCLGAETTWYPYEATVRAYSIHDLIDKDYHDARDKNARYLTSTGRDASVWTEGIAGPKSLAGRMARFTIPGYSQYQTPGNTTRIDDTGGMLRSRVRRTKTLHLELRFPTTEEAKKFGVKTMTIYLDTPWLGLP